MKHANRLIFTIITSAVILLLSSCQVTQKMELTPAMGGKSTTDLVTDDFFEGVIEDLSTWTPDNPEDAVMETAIKSFVEKLNTTENAFLINFDLTKEHEYDGTFRFKGLEPLFTELTDDSVKDLLRFREAEAAK